MNNTVTRQVLGKVAMTSRGEYDTSKSYEILDIVTYQGSSYLSKKYNNDSLPTNANDWQLLAQKGDTYELSEEDLQRIAEQITSNANSAFNQNVKEKTDSFNSNASSKTEAYNTNATEKLGTYNSNHTAKLKEYNDNATSKLSAYNTNSVTKTTEYNSNHTNKLNAYDTNASNKVDVYNTNADTRLEEYNTNADNKIAEYDEHSKELNNKIVSIGNDYRMVKDQLLYTGEDTDTFIHVEDSAMAEMKELSVDGVCEQKTTTGKNLYIIEDLDYIKTHDNTSGTWSGNSYTSNGITFTPIYNSNGTLNYVNISGTATDNASLFLSGRLVLSAGTYTIGDKGTGQTGVLVSLNGGNYPANKTFTLSEETTYYQTRLLVRPDAGTLTNYKVYPMIVAGSTLDDHEPYTGNQPSPSPSYPQPISVIENSLKITSTDSNIFDITNSVWKENVGVSLVGQKQRNSITINGLSSWSNIGYMFRNVRKNTNMVLSADFLDTVSNTSERKVGFTVYGSDNNSNVNTLVNISSRQENIDTNSTKRITLKFNSGNKDYIYIRFWNNATNNNLTNRSNLTISNIKLEFGDKETAYSELYSQITANLPEGEFIGKIDDTYKDTLRTEYFPKEGQYHWMLDKMIGHITFTGATDENWTQINLKPELFQIRINSIYMIPSINDKGTVLSNYLITVNPSVQWTNNSSCITNLNDDKMIRVRFKDNPFSTAAEYKNWLSTHNLDTYYALETPYTVDLGVIDMPISYKDITNIFTDSDLLPTINAKYYRVFDKTIQNAQINEKTLKQEITDLNTTVSALDTRLKALENKTTEEPTESEGTV